MDWASRISSYLNLAGTETASRGELLAFIGEGVQAAIERRTGRTFGKAEYTDTLDGNGRRMLFLPHDPVIEVLGAQADSADVLPSVIVRDRVGLVFTNGAVWPCGVGNVSINYTAGYNDEPPPDLVQAGVRWAAAIFRARDRIGISTTGAAGQSTSFTEDLPAWAEKVIAAHVRWDRSC